MIARLGSLAIMTLLVACTKSSDTSPPASSTQTLPSPPPLTSSSPSPVATNLKKVGRTDLLVTHGSVSGDTAILVREPEVRAIAKSSAPDVAEIKFTYRGPSEGTKPLGSGEVRRQIGLKLRAESGCNLVYVMWRIEPKAELVVSVKENPGQHTHAECGTHGYRNIKGDTKVSLPTLTIGESHVLRGTIEGTKVHVSVDGTPVATFDIGPIAFTGPVGFRTDNGAFDVDLYAAAGSSGAINTDEE